MRHLWFSITALGLFGVALGCHNDKQHVQHTAGVCDCLNPPGMTALLNPVLPNPAAPPGPAGAMIPPPPMSGPVAKTEPMNILPGPPPQ